MELDIQKIKDDVAIGFGYETFLDALKAFDRAKCTYQELNLIVKEIAKEVHKQTAEAQRKICTDKVYKHYFDKGQFIDTEPVLSAPSPKIK